MEGINYSQIIQDILNNHFANDVANGTEYNRCLTQNAIIVKS